jgi:hypothetical protein
MDRIEADDPTRPIPDFDDASIEVLFCLLYSRLIVGALYDRGRAVYVTVLVKEINAIFLHDRTHGRVRVATFKQKMPIFLSGSVHFRIVLGAKAVSVVAVCLLTLDLDPPRSHM